MENNMIKVSFTGDISLDKPLLNASKNEDGTFSFDRVFKEILPLFKASDFLVGNLETVFGGASEGYNVKPFSYNSPDSFLVELKKCGFDLLTIANNHCLDEGIAGLKRTIELCRINKIDITGMAGDENFIVKNIGGVKVAFISYAHAVNKSKSSDKINNIQNVINLLYPYGIATTKSLKSSMVSFLPSGIRERLKRLLGMPTIPMIPDALLPEMKNEEYIFRLKDTIRKAKEISDLVVMCIHCGGQFNEKPGRYSEFIIDEIRNEGVDLIIGNHPHVIQKIECKDHNVAAYSLGGLTLSPSAEYVHQEALADYSLAIHAYIHKSTKEIIKVTYSLIHGCEDENKYLYLRPADVKHDEKAQMLVHRIGNKISLDQENYGEIVVFQREEIL